MDLCSRGSLLSVRMIRPKPYIVSLIRVLCRVGANLGDSIDHAAHSKDPFHGTTRIIANGALGTRQSANLRDILAALANDGRGLCARND